MPLLMATVQGLIFLSHRRPQSFPTNEASRQAREAQHLEMTMPGDWLQLPGSVLWTEYGEPLQSGSEDMKMSSSLSQLHSLTKSQIKCSVGIVIFNGYCEVYTCSTVQAI